MTDQTTIRVDGPTAYDVVVGHGVTELLPTLVAGASAVVVVADAAVSSRTEHVAELLRGAGTRVHVHTVAGGEQAKTLSSAATLWDEFGAHRLTRADAVVAVGGGATTDVAGFAAATWLRGIRVVHVPTTLLAMVDAAVGGKTGINTAAGKNLVGAFHPPAGVLVDLDVLATLPRPEWVNGMAEVVKAGFVDDPRILDLVDADPAGAARPDGPHTRELIERSIAMKARVVSVDLKEAGPREALNYGHTLGHAIERVEDYAMPHGHAVSIGMVFAAELSLLAGRLDEPTAARHRPMLAALGLPVRYDADALPRLTEVMAMDKKSRGDRLRFVVLDGLGKPGILEAPEPALVESAYATVAAS
jgi:3-dehydroquinate synthase